MHFAERRSMPRKEVKVALQYRPVGGKGLELLPAESVNFSERGIFFTTVQPLRVGTLLEVFLTIPSGRGGATPAEARCTARVVHVKPNAGPGGQTGVGACIERYEPSFPPALWKR
jgi:hypothetical protein